MPSTTDGLVGHWPGVITTITDFQPIPHMKEDVGNGWYVVRMSGQRASATISVKDMLIRDLLRAARFWHERGNADPHPAFFRHHPHVHALWKEAMGSIAPAHPSLAPSSLGASAATPTPSRTCDGLVGTPVTCALLMGQDPHNPPGTFGNTLPGGTRMLPWFTFTYHTFSGAIGGVPSTPSADLGQAGDLFFSIGKPSRCFVKHLKGWRAEPDISIAGHPLYKNVTLHGTGLKRGWLSIGVVAVKPEARSYVTGPANPQSTSFPMGSTGSNAARQQIEDLIAPTSAPTPASIARTEKRKRDTPTPDVEMSTWQKRSAGPLTTTTPVQMATVKPKPRPKPRPVSRSTRPLPASRSLPSHTMSPDPPTTETATSGYESGDSDIVIISAPPIPSKAKQNGTPSESTLPEVNASTPSVIVHTPTPAPRYLTNASPFSDTPTPPWALSRSSTPAPDGVTEPPSRQSSPGYLPSSSPPVSLSKSSSPQRAFQSASSSSPATTVVTRARADPTSPALTSSRPRPSPVIQSNNTLSPAFSSLPANLQSYELTIRRLTEENERLARRLRDLPATRDLESSSTPILAPTTGLPRVDFDGVKQRLRQSTLLAIAAATQAIKAEEDDMAFVRSYREKLETRIQAMYAEDVIANDIARELWKVAEKVTLIQKVLTNGGDIKQPPTAIEQL
ncbi:unnamed protein product [Peniophora sp. CBMAI 1063]|nr:unnamed protein product [Peniophora sp. CBMAI 1063]